MSLIETRASGNAPGLPGAMPFGVLSRRAALFGAVTVAGFGASFARPVLFAAAIISASSPAAADARLIAHADRLVALVRRCEAAADHRAALEDRVSDLCPRPAPPPKPSLFADMQIDDSSPTKRVITAIKSPSYDLENAAWEKACAAVEATHERQETETASRFGLPGVERRWARMNRRCDRWAADLAAMEPNSAAGLGAKTGALLALLGDAPSARFGGLDHHADLVLSVLADTVRLGAGGHA